MNIPKMTRDEAEDFAIQMAKNSGLSGMLLDVLRRFFNRLYKRCVLPKLYGIVTENRSIKDINIDTDAFHVLKLEDCYKALLTEGETERMMFLKLNNYELWLSQYTAEMKALLSRLRWENRYDKKPFVLLLGSKRLADKFNIPKKRRRIFMMCDREYEEAQRSTLELTAKTFLSNHRYTHLPMADDEYENSDHLCKLCVRYLNSL